MSDQKLNKVLRHPNKEQIIEKLLNGESVKSVEDWLRKKHPKSRRLQITWITLQKFRKEHLGLDGQMLDDLKRARKEQDKQSRAADAQMIVGKSNAYQEKINSIASKELDVRNKLIELYSLGESRLEHWFNVVSNGGTMDEDKTLLDYISAQRSLLQDWKKMVEGMADKTIEHNINIQVVSQQVGVLKEIVFEVLREMQPSLIPVFVDKVNRRLSNLEPGSQDFKSYQNVIDVKID